MWKERARRASIVVAKLGQHLWREATAVDDRDWPPAWLYIGSAVIACIVLVSVGSFAMTSLLSSVGTSAKSSNWGAVIEVPLRAYIKQHSSGLPVSPAQLIYVWGFAGFVFFALSCWGNHGARVGWTVFGLFSCGAIYAGTHPPTQWTATGVAALAWSGASVFAFNSVRRFRSRRRLRPRTREQEADLRYEEMRKRARLFAMRRGYKDLEEYFAERGNQTIGIIASELRIPKTKVDQLRGDYLEAGISVRGALTPRQQREIRADIRSGKYSNTEIRERNGCSQAVVRRMRASIDVSDSGRPGEHESDVSPQSVSPLPETEHIGDELGLLTLNRQVSGIVV
jgi:hypothetical protein